MKRVDLRTVRMAIMAHEEELELLCAALVVSDRARCRVQIRGAVVDVRLQVGGLSPFVPSIDKDERLAVERALFGKFADVAQPRLVLDRRGAVIHRAGTTPTSLIVP